MSGRSKREIETVIEDLSSLSVYAREQAETLSDKNSTLYIRIRQLADIVDKLLEAKHYPTIGCIQRIRISVKECLLDEISVTVKDFKKILGNV